MAEAFDTMPNSEIAQFCAKWSLRIIVQSAIFSRKNIAQRKQKFVLAIGNPTFTGKGNWKK